MPATARGVRRDKLIGGKRTRCTHITMVYWRVGPENGGRGGGRGRKYSQVGSGGRRRKRAVSSCVNAFILVGTGGDGCPHAGGCGRGRGPGRGRLLNWTWKLIGISHSGSVGGGYCYGGWGREGEGRKTIFAPQSPGAVVWIPGV